MSTPHDRIAARLGLSGPPLHRVRDESASIPDHELKSKIGQGAYGEVWLARNALGTARAVKIVYRDNFKNDRPYEREFAGIRRFEPLSRANEGFVDILQVGRNEQDGWFYYVMELADNIAPVHEHGGSHDSDYTPHTLARELHQRERLPLRECLELGLTLSLALGHLHRHGLIHRDVKPSNIIFVGGVPKLADIGLVTESSEANTFVGTEGYVPPEGPTSAQADIFALGKVLYEAAMGKDRKEFPEPFTEIRADAESLALMELNAVLLRACAADPKNRYASAEELHADLALLHSGGSVKRRHLMERRFRLVQRAGVLAGALTVVALIAWRWQHHQTDRMTRLANDKSVLAAEKTRLADDLAKLGADNREHLLRLRIANGIRSLDDGDSAGALLWFAEALPLITNNLAEEAIHRIRIQQTLDRTPRLLKVFAHESTVESSAFSPDGQFVATGTQGGNVRLWNARSATLVWKKTIEATATFIRFSRDGKRLFICSSRRQGWGGAGPHWPNCLAVLNTESGEDTRPAAEWPHGLSTNLIFTAFSPDDRWLALSESGNNIRVFDLAHGGLVANLQGHSKPATFLSFDERGSLLASSSFDKTVRLWRIPSGQPVGQPLEHPWPVLHAFLSDDGKLLASAARDTREEDGQYGAFELHGRQCVLQAWDVSSGELLPQTVNGFDAYTLFLEPGPTRRIFGHINGPRYANRIFAWDTAFASDPAVEFNLPGVQCWAFASDAKRLALGGDDYTARVFERETGKVLDGPFYHNRWVQSVQFSPDGKQLLTGSDDQTARLWDLARTRAESARVQTAAPIRNLRLDSFAAQIGHSTGSFPLLLDDGTARIMNDRLEEVHRLTSPEPGRTIHAPASAADGSMWAFCRYGLGRNDPTGLYLWREDGFKLQQFTLEHPATIQQHIFTSDNRFCITYAHDRTIRFWRTADGALERTLETPQKAQGYVAIIAPDASLALWHQSSEGTKREEQFQCLDLVSGKFLSEPFSYRGPINALELSPNKRFLAVGDINGPISVFSVTTGERLSSFKHSANLSWIAWSPDSTRFLSAGFNEDLLVWDPRTGTQLLPALYLPGGAIHVARWSPDGRFVIGRNDAGKVRVWDATTGEALTPLLTHSTNVYFAMMTSGSRLITATAPNTVQAWDLKPTALPQDVLLDYARFLSGRRLNSAGLGIPLKADEFAELFVSLRKRRPDLFK